MEPQQSMQALDPLVAQALALREDVDRFKKQWPSLPEGEPCFHLRWDELERQLVDLAPTDLQAELVHRLIARARTFAVLKPSEMVLRELLCIAALVLEGADQSLADDDV